MCKGLEMFKEMVEETGAKVGVESDECTLHKTTHENCKGCQYELGCCKHSALGILSLAGARYQAKDFDDSIAALHRVSDLMSEILKAKTTDDVRTIL